MTAPHTEPLATMFSMMKSHIINIWRIPAALFLLSCSARESAITPEKYSTLVVYDDNNKYQNPEKERKRTERLLTPDSIYIFFENGFESDTVEVRLNDSDNPEKLSLKTNKSVGVSDMIHYKIKSVDKIEIRKNNGPPLVIKLMDKTMNLWTVNFYNDTLRAQRRKYLPWYE